MEEDIKILEEMFYDDESFKPNGYIEIFLHKNEQQAIKNLIARYKETKQELDSVKEIYYTQKEIEDNYISKAKVEEKIEHRIKKLEKMQEEDMKSDDRYYDEYDYEMTLLKSVERELLED